MSPTAATIVQPKTSLSYEADEVTVRVSPVYDASQRYQLAVIWPWVLCLYQYAFIMEHHRNRWLYDSTQQRFYRPHLANNVNSAECDCQTCARKRHTSRRQCKLRRFLPAETWAFVSIEVPWPLPKTKAGNQFIFVLTNRFSKLKKECPRTKKTAATVAAIFINDWVVILKIPSKFLTDDRPQFTSECFHVICKEFKWSL